MKKEDFAKAVGQIDEKYITEAEYSAERIKVTPALSNAERSAKRKSRIKWASGLAAVLVIGLCLGSFFDSFTGFDFMKMGSSNNFASKDTAVFDEDLEAASSGEQKNTANMDDGDINNYVSLESAGPMAEDAAYNAASNVKLIYRADVSLQTTEFDESVAALQELVKKCGGYFESTEISNGSYYSEGSYKSGYYVVRVPQGRYREFLDSLHEASYVVSMSESVEDIGLEYFETEGRLETLKIKEDRLQNLMREANNMSDIIELENALSDTQYQIDMYSSTLNRYDSLVNYSTVCVNLEKVVRYENGIDQDQSFFARLAQNLKDGAANFLYALDCFANWISYNLITLAIIAVIIIVACKFHWLHSIRSWWSGRRIGKQ